MATPELDASGGLVSGLVHSVTSSYLNVFLTAICIGLVYLIYKTTSLDEKDVKSEARKVLKPFPKGDMTLAELRKFDGKDEEGRLLLAVNREIYDVTKGWRFYGPEGPYAPLAGRDATRALAQFSVDAVKDEWDDYSGLSVSQMNTVTEWLEQFKEKYDYVGKLVEKEADKSTKGPAEASSQETDVAGDQETDDK